MNIRIVIGKDVVADVKEVEAINAIGIVSRNTGAVAVESNVGELAGVCLTETAVATEIKCENEFKAVIGAEVEAVTT